MGLVSRPRDRDVLRTMPDAVVAIDAHGTLVGAWGACLEVFGEDYDEVVGTDAFSRVHPGDIEFAAGAVFEAIGRDGDHVPANIRVRSATG